MEGVADLSSSHEPEDSPPAAILRGVGPDFSAPTPVGFELGTPGREARSRGHAIELRGARKWYRSHHEWVAAVDGIDLSVGSGEFFSLLGPSGCGKTTTMRAIAGFEVLDEGQLLLDGVDVARVPAHRRDINMVFQSYALFPHLTVWDNIAFGLRRRRVPAAEVRQRVHQIIDVVGLAGRERRRPQQLSGGQQQRVALARALVNRPAALLLDEPLGALDLQLRQEMQVELKRVQREVAIAFVYVTHDQHEALALSDRVAVMNAGRIEQIGTPQEVYERPASVFVARFIGSSNVLTGNLLPYGAVDIGASAPVRVDGQEGRVGGRVSVTVRPERLKIVTGHEATSSEPELPGQVLEVIYQGMASLVSVLTSAHGVVTVAMPVDSGQSSRALGRGAEVRVQFPSHGVHEIADDPAPSP